MIGKDPCPSCGETGTVREISGYVGVRLVGGATLPKYRNHLRCSACGWEE
jgi:predicted RNA-binding Zn-ribbon protein involved in translation (DUF1610 family)